MTYSRPRFAGDKSLHGVGIIGLGLMGQRFAQAAEGHPEIRVVAHYDPYAKSAVGTALATASAKDLICHPDVECVYIASPPATHLDLINQAAKAGKAIFCEKPLCTDVADAHAAVGAVEAAGVAAAVNYPHATASAALELQRIVQSGELGPNVAARLTLRFAEWPRRWQAQAGDWLRSPTEGGFVREVISHFLYLAGRLFGPGKLVERSIQWGPATEEILHCKLDFNGVELVIDGAVTGDIEDHNSLEVRGELAAATLFDWYQLHYGQTQIGEGSAPTSQLDELGLMLDGHDHRLASFEEACSVVQLVEAIVLRQTS
ncbi:Gfo/Idh/MocA family protein [Sphingomonas xanthus]|uniref:Gfo/Idh/MocA family oxidoreductase n=1 Tax=Sphingomonas xanthus TaxID=2594473 RepID=A0A516INW0_9SPHN|nr:Gfo/Idh/MocA family oxidoreductase [Sphingomonas xanthus]QDP18536.1 Gfo/Idh/MocA family oxidoreductase [Sphingomonas xanthus]